MNDTFANLNAVLKSHGVKPLRFEPLDSAQAAAEKIRRFREAHGLLVTAPTAPEEGTDNGND